MSLYYSDARKINCDYSHNCLTLDSADSLHYKNLVVRHCSNFGKECGTKLKLINKDLRK